VARTKHDTHLYELAKLGARTHLSDLLHEAKLLIGLFPDLRDSFDKDELPVTFILKKGRDRAAGGGRRRHRSTATARRTVADPAKKH
jgi:hypothetical protein